MKIVNVSRNCFECHRKFCAFYVKSNFNEINVVCSIGRVEIQIKI